jgi:hypothetical protein
MGTISIHFRHHGHDQLQTNNPMAVPQTAFIGSYLKCAICLAMDYHVAFSYKNIRPQFKVPPFFLLSNSVLPNSRVPLRVRYANDGNIAFSFDKKHSIGKPSRQSTPNRTPMNNREKMRIPFD